VAILYILIVNRRLRRYGRDLKARQEELLRKTVALEAVSAEHRCEVERGERMDRTLQENEERTRTILNHIAEGVLTVDENGLIGFFNPAAERIFGYGAEEMVGKNVSILVPEPHRGRHDGYIRNVLQTGRAKMIGGVVEVTGLRKDGTILNLHLSVGRVKLAAGDLFVGVVRDITEAKRVESVLRDLTVLQRAILDSANYSIISATSDGVIRTFNAAAERWLGYRAEEVVGRATPMWFHDAGEVERHAESLSREFGQAVAPGFEAFVAMARRGVTEEREWTYVRKDGSRFPVRLSVTALRDDRGTITGFLGIGSDLTKWKEVGESLRKLSRAVEQSPVTIVITDLKGNIEYVNPKFTQVTGYTSEEAIGRNPRILKSGEQPPSLYQELWATIASGREWRGEFRNRKKNGEYYWESASISPVKDSTGTITHYIAVKEDITKMKEALEELAKLSLVASKTDNAVLITDAQGRIEWVNDGFTRLTGYGLDEIAGKMPRNVLEGPLTDPQAQDRIRRLLGEKRGFAEEIVNYRKDGSHYWISLTVTPIFDKGGKLTKFISVGSDITKRKRVEAELQAAKEVADTANRAKSEFLAGMSHEIRTPMNAIIGMADLLWESPLSMEQKQYVRIFRSAGENLLTLINDILDLSKVEAGHLELESVNFDLGDLVEKVCDIMVLKAEQKKIELICRVAPEVPQRLVGDPLRLRQVLLNLMGNAIKFTEKGEVLLDVSRGENARPDGEEEAGICWIRFSVKDTGIGIPGDKLSNVFNSFTQVDSSVTRKYGGSGLGLTISQRLVELMGGRIAVQSELGRGSDFAFTACFGLQTPGESVAPAPDVGFEGVRTLVVDDNATNRLILVETLSRWNVPVITADSGEAALREMRDAWQRGAPFQLVLLDRRMPGMDGLEVAKAVRADPRLQGTSLILLTSDVRSGDLKRAKELGISWNLIKPIKRKDLQHAIQVALSGSRAEERPTPVAEARPLDRAVAGQPDQRPLSILLVEDSKDNRILIQAYLKKTPYQLDLAMNGQEALEKVKSRSYDLVLMDMQMPVMDGYTATREIRKWEKERGGGLRRLPIVALTASALKEDIDRSLGAGCDVHLPKPISKVTLLEMIVRQTEDRPTV
ncbi:MAG: PAS domain S-box protein, partial [Deltaproteobacteria bacterium]|nr:PAS domain S-box protein [Deltaproteobacteria bacterium]